MWKLKRCLASWPLKNKTIWEHFSFLFYRKSYLLSVGLQIGSVSITNSYSYIIVFGPLQKLKVELPYDTAFLHLGTYPKNTKPLIPKEIYTTIFIVALFILAQLWKQLKFPTADEGIRNTMEFYSVIRQCKISPFATTW